MTWGFLCLSWTLGVVTGFYLARGRYVKGWRMRLPDPFAGHAWSQAPTFTKLSAYLTVAMALMTVLLAVTYFRAGDALENTNALASCQKQATDDALVFWRKLKAQFSTPRGESESAQEKRASEFFAALDDYIASLERLQEARKSDDPAAVCERGKP